MRTTLGADSLKTNSYAKEQKTGLTVTSDQLLAFSVRPTFVYKRAEVWESAQCQDELHYAVQEGIHLLLFVAALALRLTEHRLTNQRAGIHASVLTEVLGDPITQHIHIGHGGPSCLRWRRLTEPLPAGTVFKRPSSVWPSSSRCSSQRAPEHVRE